MLGKINVRVIISLPEPRRAIIVDPYAHGANVFAFVRIARLIKPVDGDSIVVVQAMPPQDVCVLLVSMETNIDNAKSVEFVIAANLVSKPDLHRVVGIKGKIVERPQVGPRITKNTIVVCAKFGIE